MPLLLFESPIKNITVLGFDPAYRTGCKLAVIDENGKLLATKKKRLLTNFTLSTV